MFADFRVFVTMTRIVAASDLRERHPVPYFPSRRLTEYRQASIDEMTNS
jgi:hypothetical protein